MAQRLDLQQKSLTGDPITVADPVAAGNTSAGGASVSAAGLVAYRAGGASLRQLTWFDRTGKAVGVVGEPDANMFSPALSPDGRRVAIDRTVQGNRDVWLMDLAREGITRFTFDAAVDGYPIWSPDGSRIAFESKRKGGSWTSGSSRRAGQATEELLLETPYDEWPFDWSKDGRFLLYHQDDPKTGPDLWSLPMTGNDRKPAVVVNTPFTEQAGQFSPDGRWVAYETNESGRFEIVVQPFPAPSGKWQLSTDGGRQPRWRADGKELYFISPDGNLVSVAVAASGSTFEAGRPAALFPTRILGPIVAATAQYTVSRDGRFLINQTIAHPKLESRGEEVTLAVGSRLGPYEVTAQIGVGGMGEVYRATDTRLDRTVAIKVLPEHVASDSELRQRFEREAKTLAALSHPHICPVFDVGSQDGIDFLVMEDLQGETLAQRLTKGALPLEQALQVAIQIADALDKAHRKGIVHRDLKPGNIMLTKGGAKLLDFGLAKRRPSSVAGGVAPSEALTASGPLTGAGGILGTFQYMAPEQVEGQEADARTDIFAYGAVVYEMVTGKKAFEGKSQASLIAAILERDPAPMSSLQPVSTPTLDRVVKKSLAKSADQRWQSAKDLHDELAWIASAGIDAGAGAPAAAPASRRMEARPGLVGVFCRRPRCRRDV